jgi:hypothetical protein
MKTPFTMKKFVMCLQWHESRYGTYNVYGRDPKDALRRVKMLRGISSNTTVARAIPGTVKLDIRKGQTQKQAEARLWKEYNFKHSMPSEWRKVYKRYLMTTALGQGHYRIRKVWTDEALAAHRLKLAESDRKREAKEACRTN